MNTSGLNTKRINWNYAILQGVFWMANASIATFAAVYLSYRGLNDLQIGISTALDCFLAIVMQIFVADYLDHHMEVPIKNVLALLFLIGGIFGALLIWAPLPTVGVIICFVGAVSILLMTNGLINAQMMQFTNVGIPAEFGWPRGIGSLCYALSSILYGNMTAKHGAGVIPMFFLVMIALCILFVMTMPNPYKYVDPMEFAKEHEVEAEQTSYKTMLLTNPTLLIALICVIVYSVGQSGALTFMIRVIESVGCGESEYGITEAVRAGVEVPMLFASVYVLKKISVKTAVVISLLASAVRIFMIAFAGSMTLLYAASALNILCSGIYLFASVLFVDEIVRPTEKVRAQSLLALFYSIGSVLGNFLSGAMLGALGTRPSMLVNGGFCVLSGICFMTFVKNKKQ